MKLMLCQSFGIEAYPHGKIPERFPIFSKPICNMWGMGIGAEVLDSWDCRYNYKAGYMWMPVLKGVQCSTDIAILNGEPVWHYSMEAIKDDNGSFLAFRQHMSYDIDKLKPWLDEYMSDFTGIVNIECIGGVPIEVHLRMSAEFMDLYGGDCWLRAVVDLYENGRWEYRDTMPPGYCYLARIPKSKEAAECVPHFDPGLVKSLESQGVTIRLTNDEGEPLKNCLANDEFTYRIAIINGYDPDICEEVRDVLKNHVLAAL